MGRQERKARRAAAEGFDLGLLLLLEFFIWAACPIIFGAVGGGIGFATFSTTGLIIGGIAGVVVGLIADGITMFDFDLFDWF